MMSLTRWKKEQFVLELYNQGKTSKEIAKVAHMSLRYWNHYPRTRGEARSKTSAGIAAISIIPSLQTFF
jgi:hypothetical protein